MPRIPEGKFRTEPSSRVERTANVRIDAGNTQRIRSLGQGFTKVADQLRNAKRTADALNSADEVDQFYQNNVIPELEGFTNSSINGKVKDPKTGEDRAYSEVIAEKLNEYDAKALETFGDDGEALSYYASYTKPKLEKQLSKAKVFENAQIVDHRNGEISKGINLSVQRYIDNDLDPEDFAALQDKIVASGAVIGEKQKNKHLTTLYKNLAYSAPQIIAAGGSSRENQARAKKYFSYLSEDERRYVDRAFEKQLLQTQTAEMNMMYTGGEKTLKGITDFKTAAASGQALNKLKDSAYKNTINPATGETPQNRIGLMGDIHGKEIAWEAMSANAAVSLDQFRAYVEKTYDNNIARGVASAEVMTLARDDKQREDIAKSVKEKSINKALEEFRVYSNNRDRKDGGATDIHAGNNPTFQADLESGDPTRRENAIQGLLAWNKEANVSMDRQSLVTNTHAESLGKTFSIMDEGQGDIHGELGQEQVEKFRSMYGDYSPRAAMDAIRLGGGTKAGKTDIPKIFALAARMPEGAEESAFVKDMFSDRANYLKRLDRLKGREGDDIKVTKTNFENAVRQAMVGSEFETLHMGRRGENQATYEAMFDAIKHKAAYYADKQGMSTYQAVQKAMGHTSNYFMAGRRDSSSIMVDRAFIKKFNPEQRDLQVTTKQLQGLQHLDKLGVEIDFDAMIKLASGNQYLSENLEVFQKAKALGPQEANEFLANSLDVMVVTDSNNSNAAKLYLRPANGSPIALLAKAGTQSIMQTQDEFQTFAEPKEVGKIQLHKDAVIDLEKYYPLAIEEDRRPVREAAERRRARSDGTTPMGRISRFAQ